ncbi:MAG: hypothetical protein AAF211_26270 [Myxococcota bacterium]
MRTVTLALMAIGCTEPEPELGPTTLLPGPQPGSPVDSGTPPQPGPPTEPGELHGQFPAEPVALPAFAAVNRDGAPRGPEHLRGSVTAMWFYPAAFTGG